MSWAAMAAVVVGAALSAGAAAAMQPNFGDPKKQSKRAVMASLRMLPGQRRAEMAAKLGIPVDYETGRRVPVMENLTVDEAESRGFISPNEANRLRGLHQKMVEVQTGTKIETKHADFTGLGDADVQGQIARKMAQVQLDLQKKYGADFIDEAKKQQELADPEGTAARKLLYDEIVKMDEDRATRKRPVADALNTQIIDELKSGSGLTGDSQAAIAETLARRGGTTIGTGDITSELETGIAGDARTRDRIARAMSYLGSGNAPTDAAFRDRQQSLANMASFLSGRTPQSQFAGNQAAQQGASPMPAGAPLPNVAGNLNQQAGQVGLGAYNAGVRVAANQANPYMAGLAMIVEGGNMAGKAGWQPFAAKK